jgi:hypothetical protein
MATLWNEKNAAALQATYEKAIEANKGEALDQKQLEKVADEFEVTVHSARQKLVAMKCYVAADVKRKVGGASATRKINIVNDIEKATGLKLESLEKANKQELESLKAFIDQHSDQE